MAVTDLEHLAAIDTNIAALVGWGITPRIDESMKVVYEGVERLDNESKDGLRRWLQNGKEQGVPPRASRIRTALLTGRNQAALILNCPSRHR